MLQFLYKGSVDDFLKNHDVKYDFINMDNVLEHLPYPDSVIKKLKSVCHENTIICIKVPNDFSITQINAYENGCIDDAFWVTDKTSEHFNYFTLESLKQLAEMNGFKCVGYVADWPIDINLFNPRTNYIKDKNVGHDGHVAKLKVENMLFKESIEKTMEFHLAIANLGIGRNISVFIKMDI